MPISRCHIVEKIRSDLEDESIEITQKLKENSGKIKRASKEIENNVRWSNKLDDKIQITDSRSSESIKGRYSNC